MIGSTILYEFMNTDEKRWLGFFEFL